MKCLRLVILVPALIAVALMGKLTRGNYKFTKKTHEIASINNSDKTDDFNAILTGWRKGKLVPIGSICFAGLNRLALAKLVHLLVSLLTPEEDCMQ